MLEYLDSKFDVIRGGMFTGKTDLREIRVQLDYISEYLPFLMDRVVEMFYNDSHFDGLAILPDNIAMKQYLLTKGYLPKERHQTQKRDIMWYMLSTSPEETSMTTSCPDVERLFHLMVVPRYFDFHTTYIRFDNFDGWSSHLVRGQGMYGSSDHLDYLEAVLQRGYNLDSCSWLFKQMKHDLIDRWKAGRIKIGVKLREALRLDLKK